MDRTLSNDADTERAPREWKCWRPPDRILDADRTTMAILLTGVGTGCSASRSPTAYAHVSIACVHPFADGNERVTRAPGIGSPLPATCFGAPRRRPQRQGPVARSRPATSNTAVPALFECPTPIHRL